MRFQRPRHRGVTLVEMMVSVALLVVMMTILVTVFGAATGAISGLQSFQQLDGDLRQLDMTIRQDLIGVTARMTPPLDPGKNLGYFEYGENAFADLQNEDTDDYIRFTAKAPEGQLFTGRAWTSLSNTATAATPQPIFITSQYAEIIYFLRNGNLYRRVLLIAPDRQDAVNQVWAATVDTTTGFTSYKPPMFGGALAVSWQGVNDLSAHPATSSATTFPIQLNTLGDTTNRENRAFYPHFSDDFVDMTSGTPVANKGDGVPDDLNMVGGVVVGDGVPDYWPTLYTGSPLIFESGTPPNRVASTESMAFPFIYPGAYSAPDSVAGSFSGSGWIHCLDPGASTNSLLQLKGLNHSPMEFGDSLPNPSATGQTWWGFPTWKETASPNWHDPTLTLVVANGQPDGLHPMRDATKAPSTAPNAASMTNNFLPPMTAVYRVNPQPYTDGVPVVTAPATPLFAASPGLWAGTWEDDLILTGVRSFDVKAYDDSYPGYVDLGWGDDLRLYPTAVRPTTPPFLLGNPPYPYPGTPTVNAFTWNGNTYNPFNLVALTYAHEGRMPPLLNDTRLDANYPLSVGQYPTPPYSSNLSYSGNVGDTNASVMRLRRVWDSWSTDYTQAPATGFDPTTKLPVGPPWSPPIYPSYPPPYPAPLRGIQIQIRVTDPRGGRVKMLTIRQDFSDKL